MNDLFIELDATVDADAYEYLQDNYPALLESVKAAVKRGATPAQIRSRMLERAGQHRIEIATRCENAARYWQTQVKASA